MSISLNQEGGPGYHINPRSTSAIPLVLLSGATYSCRHFSLAYENKDSQRVKHIALGILQLFPVIGAIAALADWHFNKTVIPEPADPTDVTRVATRILSDEKALKETDTPNPLLNIINEFTNSKKFVSNTLAMKIITTCEKLDGNISKEHLQEVLTEHEKVLNHSGTEFLDQIFVLQHNLPTQEQLTNKAPEKTIQEPTFPNGSRKQTTSANPRATFSELSLSPNILSLNNNSTSKITPHNPLLNKLNSFSALTEEDLVKEIRNECTNPIQTITKENLEEVLLEYADLIKEPTKENQSIIDELKRNLPTQEQLTNNVSRKTIQPTIVNPKPESQTPTKSSSSSQNLSMDNNNTSKTNTNNRLLNMLNSINKSGKITTHKFTDLITDICTNRKDSISKENLEEVLEKYTHLTKDLSKEGLLKIKELKDSLRTQKELTNSNPENPIQEPTSPRSPIPSIQPNLNMQTTAPSLPPFRGEYYKGTKNLPKPPTETKETTPIPLTENKENPPKTIKSIGPSFPGEKLEAVSNVSNPISNQAKIISNQNPFKIPLANIEDSIEKTDSSDFILTIKFFIETTFDPISKKDLQEVLNAYPNLIKNLSAEDTDLINELMKKLPN